MKNNLLQINAFMILYNLTILVDRDCEGTIYKNKTIYQI